MVKMNQNEKSSYLKGGIEEKGCKDEGDVWHPDFRTIAESLN